MGTGKPLSKLTTYDVAALDGPELRIYLNAALGVLRMKEIDLQRAEVARHLAEYSYHAAMISTHQALQAEAERVNREGP